MISICIPTYNRCNALRRCLKKCIEINSEDIEIIVCDNHSTDGTKDAVLSINDSRIKYHCNEKNVGPSANFIIALKLAQKKYAYILNDKDDIDKDHLLKLIDYLKKCKEEPSVVYVNYKGKEIIRPSVIYSEKTEIINRDEALQRVDYFGGVISTALYHVKKFNEVLPELNMNSYLFSIYSYRCIELALFKYNKIVLFGDYIASFREEAKPDHIGWRGKAESKNEINESEIIKKEKEIYWTIYSRNKQLYDWCDYFIKLYGNKKLIENARRFLRFPSKSLDIYLHIADTSYNSKWDSNIELLYAEERKKKASYWIKYETNYYKRLVKKFFVSNKANPLLYALIVKYYIKIYYVIISRSLRKGNAGRKNE